MRDFGTSYISLATEEIIKAEKGFKMIKAASSTAHRVH